jgi:predicted short-subunit dehydrogenase-like oxidoreductase (DUF2520 family)
VTRPCLFVAGAGAAGTALALGLSRAGWPLGEIASRQRARAVERAALLGGGRAVSFDELCDPARESGEQPVLLLVAVPDRHIAEAAGRLARRRWPAGSVALHLSGSVDVSALAPLARAGLATGGLHPLKSLLDPARAAASFADAVFALQGDPAAQAQAQAVVEALGGRPFRLSPGRGPAWHAAATHACNHLVALLDQALDLMQAAGLDRRSAQAALLPLMQGTLDNLAQHAPAEALTGPVVRGDVPVVEGHVRALAAVPPDVAAAYRALARRAVELAASGRGLDAVAAAALRDVLREPPP